MFRLFGGGKKESTADIDKRIEGTRRQKRRIDSYNPTFEEACADLGLDPDEMKNIRQEYSREELKEAFDKKKFGSKVRRMRANKSNIRVGRELDDSAL